MTRQKRLPPWHEKFQLRDGRELLIRPIRQEDAAPIRAGFSLLEPHEIRHRFLTPLDDLSEEQALRLYTPDPRSEFALVAAEPLPAGEALVGAVARASVPSGARHAEYAILVTRFIAGQGIGRHLMRRLVKWARGRELDQLQGSALDDNLPMLQLARSLGFQVLPDGETPGLVKLVLDLRPGATREADPETASPG